VELAVEVLVLDQTEAAGLEEVVRHVAELHDVPGAGGRSDGALLAMLRRLRGGHPVGGEDAVVAQRGVAAAEVEAAQEGERVAEESVVVVDDRAALRARV